MSRNKVRFGLLLGEIALSMAIVVNCVALIEKAKADIERPSGFVDEEMISVRSTPFDPTFKDQAHFDQVIDRDLAAIQNLPGVRSVTCSRFLPWAGGGSADEFRAQGSKLGFQLMQIYSADAKTFDVLGTNFVEGRAFTDAEVERGTGLNRLLRETKRERNADGTVQEPAVADVIISRATAKLVFGEEPALGRMLEDKDGDSFRIVGIIDAFYNPYAWPIHEYVVFAAYRRLSYENGVHYLVRAEPDAVASVDAAMEATLLRVDPGRALKHRSILEVRTNYKGGDVVVAKVLYLVIVLVVFMTFIGVAGLTSFSVTERTRQIGARRALGARKIDIVAHFLMENWLVTTMGLAVGVVLTVVLNVAVISPLNDAKVGVVPIIFACVLFWAAGLAATLLPALRGARVPPATATRNV